MKLRYGLLLTPVMVMNGMEVSRNEKLSVLYDGHSYSVRDGQHESIVQNAFVDKPLRGISKEKLQTLLTNDHYIRATRFNNSNDYKLALNGRLRGGGPLFAAGTFLVGSFVVIASTVFISKKAKGPMAQGLGGSAMAGGGMKIVADLTVAAFHAPTP